MRAPLYQVDAFADAALRGNPAAVMLLEEWLDDAVMKAIAAENNLSETAFVVPDDGRFGLRWFTPTTEVDLCGHATLAAAKVLFHRGDADDAVHFDTRVTGLVREEGRCVGVMAGDQTFCGEAVVLAIGHSARDVFHMMVEEGLDGWCCYNY